LLSPSAGSGAIGRRLFKRAQARHVLLVLLVGFREQVTAGPIGDEIEVLGARRIGGGFERGAAGIGDGARRQAVDHVGIVRRGLFDLALHDGAAERAFAAGQPVDDGRIGLQLHLALQAIDEDRRHPRALVGLAGFFLHDRGQDDQLLRRLDRQIQRAMLPDFLQQVPVRLLHALDDLLARHAAGEFIGFRQQRALARDFLDLSGERVGLQKLGDDLFGGQSLGDGQRMLDHFVLDERGDDVGKACALGELVFAVLEIAARFHHQDAADEHIRLVDHTLALQQVGDVADTESARDIDHFVGSERPRRLEALAADVERSADHD